MLRVAGPSVSRIENGLQQPRPELLQRICDLFKAKPSEFYDDDSNVEPVRVNGGLVPVLDYIQAGAFAGVAPVFRDEEMTELVPTGEVYSPDTFALRIRGESMLPEFREGDLVIIDPSISPRPEDFVVAKDSGGEATFKRYHRRGVDPSTGNIRFDLVPLNTAYETLHSTEQHIEIVGTMVEHTRKRRR